MLGTADAQPGTLNFSLPPPPNPPNPHAVDDDRQEADHKGYEQAAPEVSPQQSARQPRPDTRHYRAEPGQP